MKIPPDLQEIYQWANSVAVSPKESDIQALAFCVMALLRVLAAERDSEDAPVIRASIFGPASEANFDQEAAIQGTKFASLKKLLTELGALRKPD